jgi:hypothetical protein
MIVQGSRRGLGGLFVSAWAAGAVRIITPIVAAAGRSDAGRSRRECAGVVFEVRVMAPPRSA